MFSDINISQGSVATPLRCDGICNDLFIANFLLSVTVKEFDQTFVEISTRAYIYSLHFEPPCIFYGCHETPHRPHRPHRLRTGPRYRYMLILWVLKQDCFRCTFSQVCHRSIQLNKPNRPMAHWQSTVLRAAAVNHTAKATGGRQESGLPRLRSAVLVKSSQC